MFIVICNESMTYDDGYGRNGAPSMSTKIYQKVEKFQTEDELREWILRNENAYCPKKFEVFSAEPVTITTSISINIDIGKK